MKKYFLIATVALTAPFIALAAGGPADVKTPDTPGEITAALAKITDWMFSIFLLLAVMFIILAAFNFLTAQGNAEKFSAAKRMIIYCMVAVAIAVMAKSFVSITCSILNATCR